MHVSGELSLRNVTQDTLVCSAVTVADTPWLRLRGLLGRPEQQPGTGLLLLPSQGIHTFGMRHAIDAVGLDQTFTIVHIDEHVRPWRVRLGSRNTRCVLEMRSGEARRVALCVGDRLCFTDTRGNSPGASSVLPSGLFEGSFGGGSLRSGLKVLLAVLLCVQVLVCWNARSRSLNGKVDLRAYYAAGALVHRGGVANIYDDAAEAATQQTLFHDGSRTLHFLYPPVAVLPYTVLSLLPYRVAFIVILLVNLGCMVASAWLLARQHRRRHLSPGLLFLCFLAFYPTSIALMQGQISAVLLLIVTGFYSLERQGRPMLAGLCLAAGLVKFQVVLPIALMYLLWRRYRVAAGFAVGGAALLLASLLMIGTDGLSMYAHRLHSVGSTTLLDQHAAHLRYGMQIAAEPNLHGLATLLAGNGSGSALLTAVCSLALMVWAARQRPSVTIAVPAALLLSYHLQPYDLMLLLVPFALTGAPLQLPRRRKKVTGKHWALRSAWPMVGAVVLTAPAAPYLMLRNATVWYLLGSVAMLLAARATKSAASHGRTLTGSTVPQAQPAPVH